MTVKRHHGRTAALSALTLAALYPVVAVAEIEDQEVATCAAKTSVVERIVCYDDMAKRHDLAPSARATTPEQSGKWWTNTKTDPLNDQSVYSAGLAADSGQGRFGDNVSLVVRCSNNRTEMYINWQTFLGLDATRTTYRIGSDQAVTSSWTNSTDNQAAFFPGSPVGTLKRMLAETSFVANVTPYGENPITAIFDTTGIQAALSDIRQGCNW